MAAHKARIIFHWVTFILVVSVYAIAFAREGIEDQDVRLFWLDCHRTIGLMILALTVLRLVARIVLPFERVHETSPVMRQMARVAHVLIYAGLVAMPLLGWAQSSAKMHKFKLFGTALPRLVAHNGDLGDKLALWHENVAWALLALIGLHSLAALWHHFIRRDMVLVDMLRAREVA